MKCLLPTTASVILAVLIYADVRGQESNTPPPEMKALEKLVGTWDHEHTVKVPKETRSTNLVAKGELVLGGRFLQEQAGSDDKGKPTSTGMYTYDSNRKTYRYWFFHSSGGYWDSTGTWDESSQTFTFKGRVGAGDATMAATRRFLDETTFVSSLIVRDAGGEISYHQEGKGVRQK